MPGTTDITRQLRSFVVGTRPWSNKQLKHLSDDIRVGRDPAEYSDVMLWFNDLAAEVLETIEALDWRALLGDVPISLTARPKTIDTLRQKLIRQPDHSIATIQDVAGVRFEANMTLEQQTVVAHAIAAAFDHDSDCLSDLRDDDHSGYRAVHVRLRLRGRVEVQVRTHLQGQWANTYERAADVLGRGIRYGEFPEGDRDRSVVEALQNLSITGVKPVEIRKQEIFEGRDIEEDSLAMIAFSGDSKVMASVRERAQRNYDRYIRLKRDQESREALLQLQLAQIENLFVDMQKAKLKGEK